MSLRLFALPLGVPVAEAFARGFWARHAAEPPEETARIIVFVNTARAFRATEEALADLAPGPRLLPRLVAIDRAAELVEDDLPPAVDPLRRHFTVLRLVQAYLDATPEGPGPAAAPALTAALLALLDELDEWSVPGDALDAAVAETHAAHWQRLRAFVDLVRRSWPQIRAEAEGEALDPKARQALAVDRLCAGWALDPPPPVYAAGSTGALRTTRTLLAAIARLPAGGVVLPGFDAAVSGEVWAEIADGAAPEHPLAPFAGLFAELGASPGDAASWEPPSPPSPRARLLSEALRPAPVTDAWMAAAPALSADLTAATGGLTLLDAPSERLEAVAIAVAIREALEDPDARIALVTPNAALARRVTAELDRFAVIPDDSLGAPLAQSPPGVFLRLIADLAERPDPVSLAGLLGHPLTAPGRPRADHRRYARAYERAVLRGRPFAAETLPDWPGAPEDGADWLRAVRASLAPLANALREGASLAELFARHREAAERLSAGEAGAAPAVWEGPAGEAADMLLARLERAAAAHGAGRVAYRAVLADALTGQEIRPAPERPHPRVAILGPREARSHAATHAILAGLNDGVWPALPAADPWLSRPMRAAAGLPSPETRIGLAAHDFLHAAHRPQVVFSRAARAEGAPTVPSRWWTRLVTLIGGIEGPEAGRKPGTGTLAELRGRGDRLVALARALQTPDAVVPRAPRPAPKPPAEARPRRLSVTEIETLIRDAYAIYAKRILGLVPLDPVGRAPDFRDRGTALHRVLERFVSETPDLPADNAAAAAAFLSVADAVLAAEVPDPALRRIWRGRLARAAPWFLEGERVRRAAGRPVGLEVKGTLTLPLETGPMEIRAKADRIDRLTDGTGLVLDYKTGAPPSKGQIDSGFYQQLHLQAAILAAGGFDGIAPMPAARGAYLGLTGSGAGGKITDRDGLAAEVADRLSKVTALLSAYAHGAAYRARGLPERDDEEGDYDHLSRRAEWEDPA
ncbi:MAG: PD-(D/E)XK nuclease family protein [Paracoccaceae bacterium]